MARKKYLHLWTLVTAFSIFEICLYEIEFFLFLVVLFNLMCSCYSGLIFGEACIWRVFRANMLVVYARRFTI